MLPEPRSRAMSSMIAILNSSLQVSITLQNWTPDNSGPLVTALAAKGFAMQQPNPMQMMQGQAGPVATKLTTTALGVDHVNRRLAFVITNENTDPSRNIQEVLDVLTSIGFPANESIERIDLQGSVTLRVAKSASSDVSNAARKEFVAEASRIFERELKAFGFTLASKELFTRGVSGSPFFLRFEPLLTDDSDTKILAFVIFATGDATSAVNFAKTLYGRLKSVLASKQG